MGAAKIVRNVFISAKAPLTLSDIASKTELKSPEISMALCYLMKNRYLTREQVANDSGKGRKNVWQYKYLADRTGA
jgi:predicted transcriptional regulator